MTRLADALQECLDALAAGRARDECPLRYPELARDLEPLLQVCQRLQEVFSTEPSPVYAQAARERFLAVLAARRPPHTARRRSPRHPTKTVTTDGWSAGGTSATSAASASDG